MVRWHSAATPPRSKRYWTKPGGLTSKIHALTDGNGLPVRLTLRHTHDIKAAYDLIHDMCEGQMLLADKAYEHGSSERGAWANNKS